MKAIIVTGLSLGVAMSSLIATTTAVAGKKTICNYCGSNQKNCPPSHPKRGGSWDDCQANPCPYYTQYFIQQSGSNYKYSKYLLCTATGSNADISKVNSNAANVNLSNAGNIHTSITTTLSGSGNITLGYERSAVDDTYDGGAISPTEGARNCFTGATGTPRKDPEMVTIANELSKGAATVTCKAVLKRPAS